ncbi:pyrroline-5-carboxylate reductase [Pleomorphomonas sp. JP5]|uniref:pyrroline-5-carboxylate reductase family protein n=1 Tax=Pleomorphomonas sp. JP5 TaxID=2942998 RepID=UPI002042C33D|nr:NAD(P)-binding domain-containing protein [Pleomorphomonas sp. JP5]MCM5559223.1 NAD(P)-binding domain-containing protein [Pleomorphomonas sp. JP5]
MRTIGFVGGGRIARIMIEGWKKAGALPRTVVVFDVNSEQAARLASIAPEVTPGTLAEAASADLVIVGLHPPVLAEALPTIKGHLKPEAVLLSLAPKMKFAGLSNLLGGFSRLARQNPNAPSIVGKGYNPIAFSVGLPENERSTLLTLMEPLGDCPVVDEGALEAYALISAMGPTYLWFQLKELERLAVEFGLTDAAGRRAVEAMVNGASATLFESGLAPDDVMDLVPVKPLAADEAAIVGAYRDRLKPLFQKLTSPT